LVKLACGGQVLDFFILCYSPPVSKNDTRFRSGLKWLKNSHIASVNLNPWHIFRNLTFENIFLNRKRISIYHLHSYLMRSISQVYKPDTSFDEPCRSDKIRARLKKHKNKQINSQVKKKEKKYLKFRNKIIHNGSSFRVCL